MTTMKKMIRRTTKNRCVMGIVLLVALLSAVALYIGHYGWLKPSERIIKADTVYSEKVDTLWKDTTIIKSQMTPKIVFKTRVDTLYDKTGDEVHLTCENKLYQDTVICDGDTIEAQIFTSGIKSSVDSLSLRLRKSEIVRTNTVEITKYVGRRKTVSDRFGISLGVGYGYGLSSRRFEPFVGVTVGIKF